MHIQDERMTFVGMAVKCGLVLSLVAYILGFVGCTIKIDNPFYAPSTLDVNKNTSTGAANYLQETKKSPGVAQ